MGKLLADHLKIFTIETTVNNSCFPAPYEFLIKREWEWSIKDQASMLAVKRGLAMAPDRLKHKMFHDLRAPYGLTGVHAGETEAVHEKTIANVHRQHLVEVNGQSDVLVMGVPYLGPYNVNSTMNPILATCLGLGYYFNSYRGQPVVRKGGAVILYHPVKPVFNQLHHPSYVDFYEEVLAESTDPAVIEAKYEQQYATDPWYIHLYRTSHAYHGVHPFYMWYWAAHAMDHVGDVIWVGAEPAGRAADGLPGGVEPGGCARDRLRLGGQLAVDHVPAQPASAPRGRPLMPSTSRGPHPFRGTVKDVRQVSRGWRWGRRSMVPRSAEQYVEESESAVFPTAWSRKAPAKGLREVAQKGALEPLLRSQVRVHAEGLDVLSRVTGPGHLRGQPRLAPRHAADPAVAARTSGAAGPPSRPPPTTSSTPGGERSGRPSSSTRSRSSDAAAPSPRRRVRCWPTAGAWSCSRRGPARRTAGWAGSGWGPRGSPSRTRCR